MAQIQNIVSFICDCGQVMLDATSIKFHQNICQKVKEKYSDIFNMFESIIRKYTSKQEIQNIKLLLTVFQNQLQENYLKEEKKYDEDDNIEFFNQKLHFSQIRNNKQQESKSNTEDFEDDYEDDIEIKKFSMKEENQSQIIYKICAKCLKFTEKEKDNHKWLTIQSTKCKHMIHRECLRSISTQKSKFKINEPCCPTCKVKIDQEEIDEIFSSEKEQEFIEIEKKLQREEELKQLKELLQGLDSIARCKCGNMMIVEQGDIDLFQKDIFGQPISHCNQEPYHIGKTCEEFEKFKFSSKCRYCFEQLTYPSVSPLPAFQEVCRKEECKEMMEKSCDKINEDCKHPCCGFKDEVNCPPCLKEDCVKKDPSKTLDCTGNDYCTICYVEQLDSKQCIQLECKHIFHLDCTIQRVKLRWEGSINGINFNYLQCPSCKKEITKSDYKELHDLITLSREYREKVNQLIQQRIKIDKLDQDSLFTEPQSMYYNNIQALAISRYQFFECYQCKDPFFGGVRDCAVQANQLQAPNPEDIMCNFCTAMKFGFGKNICDTHGVEFIEFKCKYCCDLSSWFCFGTTHFCNQCHERAGNNVVKDCIGDQKCPLKGKHPANGQEYALGCAICRQVLQDQGKQDLQVIQSFQGIEPQQEIAQNLQLFDDYY
ncbi:e3 ubiquitin-protein ligase [Stylonychia lemnae]|uniref:E3 ubiquitin-protein ligase n=1 Tax=Stylonychia lemnae TaxID=5949 RepID=A0A078A6Q7_STYLE|nr:e3 ubiquitin-protein ligase [Stylonychia lemnae]|eukprot:CDW76424.1 e3 ubiquitin-protein ligase [Stylonychia lemnae]